jgi:hypothetical protein
VFSVRYEIVKYNVDENTGGACSTYEGQERCIQGFGGITEGKRPFGRPSVYGRILLKWIFKKWDWEA